MNDNSCLMILPFDDPMDRWHMPDLQMDKQILFLVDPLYVIKF